MADIRCARDCIGHSSLGCEKDPRRSAPSRVAPRPRGPKSFVSAEQVAERAGVSRSAVSRTFTPGASVSEDTRRRGDAGRDRARLSRQSPGAWFDAAQYGNRLPHCRGRRITADCANGPRHHHAPAERRQGCHDDQHLRPARRCRRCAEADLELSCRCDRGHVGHAFPGYRPELPRQRAALDLISPRRQDRRTA